MYLYTYIYIYIYIYIVYNIYIYILHISYICVMTRCIRQVLSLLVAVASVCFACYVFFVPGERNWQGSRDGDSHGLGIAWIEPMIII